jgi:hypothetical protein
MVLSSFKWRVVNRREFNKKSVDCSLKFLRRVIQFLMRTGLFLWKAPPLGSR